MSAFTYTTPHFSDAVLLLPLIANLRHKKGDTAKVMTGYGIGAASTLLFIAVFFGIYSSIAQREHYAFSKIAEYFPGLDTLGRIDLLFVYLLTVVLIFFTCLPLTYVTDFSCRLLGTQRKALFSAFLNLGLLFFMLYGNRHYNAIYAFISRKSPIIFWLIADMVPLFLIFLPNISKKHKENTHARYS